MPSEPPSFETTVDLLNCIGANPTWEINSNGSMEPVLVVFTQTPGASLMHKGPLRDADQVLFSAYLKTIKAREVDDGN